MTAARRRLVFDCNVFAQALINELCPAGRCFNEAKLGNATLYVSEYVLKEIEELHQKIPARYQVTAEDCEMLLEQISTFAEIINRPDSVYVHPIDPDDSAYVNLAIAAKAELIVSRDKHLLGLNDPGKPWSKEFRDRFPALRVLTPDQYLAERQIPKAT